jgi:hypothetical protein
MTMTSADAANTVTVAARVEPELAEAMQDLADAGDRSLSREIRRARRSHVRLTSASEYPGRDDAAREPRPGAADREPA